MDAVGVPFGVLVSGSFFAFPIAILLYWLANNVWTLVQQWVVFRPVSAPPPLPAAAVPPSSLPRRVEPVGNPRLAAAPGRGAERAPASVWSADGRPRHGHVALVMLQVPLRILTVVLVPRIPIAHDARDLA